MSSAEIEQELRDQFEENYQMLRLEGGHALTADVKEAALSQVLYYYRKMRNVAERVTETEVKLTLPDETSPAGRRFTIEGIVDIVSEQEQVWMYDIKTHDPDYIKANKDYYSKQLNVYARIWEGLRGNKLDHTAVISTAFTRGLKTAIESENKDYIAREFDKWDPLIPIDFDHSRVMETIQDFGKVVDKIENREFAAPPVEYLNKKIEGTNVIFAHRNCRNCDGRFSCPAYRQYALGSGARTTAEFKKYFEEYRDEVDQENFITANIDMEKLNEIRGDLI